MCKGYAKERCRNRLKLVVALLALLVANLTSTKSFAQEIHTPDSRSSLRFTPLTLRGGSRLTVISPSAWSDVADELVDTLRITHAHYTALFGDIPAVSARIRLMEEKEFFVYTGAPSWTNAMYYRGEVLIPLPENEPIDLENLHRSVRHEYTHAIVSSLTAGRAPGWFDEGLAQWAEGSENPHLKRVLRVWVQQKGSVPLALLQGGFTKLDQDMVPAAYAESLYATHMMLNSFGLTRISTYFKKLREGRGKKFAFVDSFSMTEETFEELLSAKLGKWAYAPPTPLELAGTLLYKTAPK